MNEKGNQNSDFLPWSSPDRDPKLAQRAEIQKDLKNQLQALKSLQEAIQSSPENSDNYQEISDKLSDLDTKIDQLDLLNEERFTLQVEKIQEQLNVLKDARDNLNVLKNQVNSKQPAPASQISTNLQGHDPSANEQRNQSAENISNINSEAGQNPLANRAASWIQKLVS